MFCDTEPRSGQYKIENSPWRVTENEGISLFSPVRFLFSVRRCLFAVCYLNRSICLHFWKARNARFSASRCDCIFAKRMKNVDRCGCAYQELLQRMKTMCSWIASVLLPWNTRQTLRTSWTQSSLFFTHNSFNLLHAMPCFFLLCQRQLSVPRLSSETHL